MAKNKSNAPQKVEVSRDTLKALRPLLFGENGVNMASIINDLSVGRDEDVVALQIGLLFKGMVKDEYTGRVAYKAHYWASEKAGQIEYYKYEVTRYSFIDNTVELKRTLFRASRNQDIKDQYVYADTFDEIDAGEEVMSVEYFSDYTTDESEVINYCRTH